MKLNLIWKLDSHVSVLILYKPLVWQSVCVILKKPVRTPYFLKQKGRQILPWSFVFLLYQCLYEKAEDKEIYSQKGTGWNYVILFQKIIMNLHSKQKGQYRKQALPLNWVCIRLPIYSSSTEKILKLLIATTTSKSVKRFFLAVFKL